MNKAFKVLIFIGILWFISFALSNFLISDSPISIGNKIAVIPITGTITLQGDSNFIKTTTSAEDIVKKIKEAEEDSSVKGIILEINSPGGTVMGSKRIADVVKVTEKPTVALITEYGASGAYWVASQCDYIYADELSIVGSIGVMGSYLELSGLLDSYNVTYQRIVGGEYKDISNPLKPMSAEEEVIIQERIDTIHTYFVTEVANGRNISYSEAKEFSEGLFYLGLEAKEINLIDDFGDRAKAVNKTKELAGIKEGKVIEYKEKKNFFNTFKEFSAHSSYYMGQGLGTTLISTENNFLNIWAK